MKFEIKSTTAESLSLPALLNVKPKVDHLFFVGDIGLLAKPVVAIVGTRNASQYGLGAAYKFAKDISEKGGVVVSGLARGVDGAAHRGALAGHTPTVAVLAHGLDRIYPPEHNGLAHQIVEGGGLILSEYGVGVRPEKYHFPLRNRIIAAVCESAIVIEARIQSGSLITAQCALDLGKDVYVLPGKYDDPGFAGGHALIQQGAQLLKNVDDIEKVKSGSVGTEESPIRKYFKESGGIATLEELFIKSRFSLSELNRFLDELVDTGRVIEIFPQQYSWITG